MAKILDLIDGDNKNTTGIAPLLFKARTDAHITHLLQPDKSLSKHNALNIFYDNIGDLIDTYVELSMGIGNVLDLNVPASSKINNVEKYFEQLLKDIDSERQKIKEPFILAVVDDIQQEIAHCLYRLKYVQ